MRYIKKTFKLTVLFALCLYSFSPVSLAIGLTEKISQTLDDPLGSAFFAPSISGDGRYVVFSTMYALLPNDTNGAYGNNDLYLYDRQTSQTTLVSVASDGTAQSDGQVMGWPMSGISAEGRYVVFSSNASNLVPGDTNGVYDIFVRDRWSGQTKRVSVASDGSQATSVNNGYGTYGVVISSDGRFIAFSSDAVNLVPNDTNNHFDVFIHDQVTGQTTRVNISSTGQQDNSSQYWPQVRAISADGRNVYFASEASNLVSGDTNNAFDTFVHDRLTHTTSLVTVDSNGVQSNLGGDTYTTSATGQFVVLRTPAGSSLAAPGDLNHVFFLRDQVAGQTSTIKAYFGGVDLFDDSSYMTVATGISADGRYLSFVHGDPNQQYCDSFGFCYPKSDAFVVDMLTSQAKLVSSNTNGTSGNFRNIVPSISADGRYVAFESSATDLIAGGTPSGYAIYVRDILLDTTQQANLKVAATAQPVSLAPASTGAYTYTITNASAKAQPVNLLHLVSKGVATSFTPSQGRCGRYATTSLCKFGLVPAGGSVTLKANVKVNAKQLLQKVVVSAAPIDPAPANNSVLVATPVK